MFQTTDNRILSSQNIYRNHYLSGVYDSRQIDSLSTDSYILNYDLSGVYDNRQQHPIKPKYISKNTICRMFTTTDNRILLGQNTSRKPLSVGCLRQQTDRPLSTDSYRLNYDLSDVYDNRQQHPIKPKHIPKITMCRVFTTVDG